MCRFKWQTRPLVREGAPIEQDSNFHIYKKKSGHGPQEGSRYQDLLTGRQSQYDFDFDLCVVWRKTGNLFPDTWSAYDCFWQKTDGVAGPIT
jgi:hypothetical protein